MVLTQLHIAQHARPARRGRIQHRVEEPDGALAGVQPRVVDLGHHGGDHGRRRRRARHGAVPSVQRHQKTPRHGRNVRVAPAGAVEVALPRKLGRARRRGQVLARPVALVPRRWEEPAEAAAGWHGAVVVERRLARERRAAAVGDDGGQELRASDRRDPRARGGEDGREKTFVSRAVLGVVPVDTVGQLVGGPAVGRARQHRHALQAQLEEFEALAARVRVRVPGLVPCIHDGDDARRDVCAAVARVVTPRRRVWVHGVKLRVQASAAVVCVEGGQHDIEVALHHLVAHLDVGHGDWLGHGHGVLVVQIGLEVEGEQLVLGLVPAARDGHEDGPLADQVRGEVIEEHI